ncbi:hypothetical protein [Subtercola endophyticus]|uniref:hypothetical protein n=1 Tax=Subtercola endophyticus TaxID=2895559 RepID=UPI001E306F32|nr:hypothetical protein [Subtercola endophyticus]UFS58875.1 hypothetical protein LQ955_18055 [Subtercola endophyticus]
MSGGSATGAGQRVLFREVTPAPAWIRVVGVLALAAAVLLIVDATLIDPSSFRGGGAVAAVIGAVVLIAVGALALVVRIAVVVDETQVALALAPVWRVRFARNDVDSAKPVSIVARDYGGAGYRVLPAGKRGLLFTSGPGVAVVRRSTKISYTVRTERATELIAALYRR